MYSLICFYQLTVKRFESQLFEMSAFEFLYGGLFTLSTQLIKPNYLQKFYLSLCAIRMAERSNAPDSGLKSFTRRLVKECSALRMECWVRVPLLTNCIFFSKKLSHCFCFKSLFQATNDSVLLIGKQFF